MTGPCDGGGRFAMGRFPHPQRSSRLKEPIVFTRRAACATARPGPARRRHRPPPRPGGRRRALPEVFGLPRQPLVCENKVHNIFVHCFRVSRTTSARCTPPISRVSRDNAYSSRPAAYRISPSVFFSALEQNAKHVHGPPLYEHRHSVSANLSAQVGSGYLFGNPPSDQPCFGESSRFPPGPPGAPRLF